MFPARVAAQNCWTNKGSVSKKADVVRKLASQQQQPACCGVVVRWCGGGAVALPYFSQSLHFLVFRHSHLLSIDFLFDTPTVVRQVQYSQMMIFFYFGLPFLW